MTKSLLIRDYLIFQVQIEKTRNNLKMKKDKEQIVQAESESGQLAGEAIVEVVKNQIKDNNPPETRETLERLIKSGETKENAMRYIASVLSIEIFGALKNHEPYNNTRYLKNLKALPKLPDELL